MGGRGGMDVDVGLSTSPSSAGTGRSGGMSDRARATSYAEREVVL